ncbi:MAG: TIGR03984 family CRISPR-associated protein [Anaerolineae bacterium]|nr:TIGR03984 family CRISPR-associated protein [Anaerolineae bacterium]
MERNIVTCDYTIDVISDVAGLATSPGAWLAAQAGTYHLTTLLAHADDGVIWGRMEGGKLITSHDAFDEVSPELRAGTLQQARFFGEDAELLAWRDGDGAWHARLLRDRAIGSGPGWCLDEAHLQWGDHQEEEEEKGFTLVAEGREGLRHAVPLSASAIPFAPEGGYHPLHLGVRHYLTQDQADGALLITHSRLTGLDARGRKES